MKKTDTLVALQREKSRRAAVSVIAIAGCMLIFRMTALVDPLFAIPSPVLYGITGVLFGALGGTLQRADKASDRLRHALVGAVVLGSVFVLFSVGEPRWRIWRSW